MSAGNLGQLATVTVIAFFAIRAFRNWWKPADAALTIAEKHQPTVEAEQDATRAVAAHAPLWPLEVPEVHDYRYDMLDDTTPESVMSFINHKHQARLQ